MKFRTLLLTGALALSAFAGMAQADTLNVDSSSNPQLIGNIKKVVAMTEQQTSLCKVIPAEMTFINNAGQTEDLHYRKMSEACDFNN